MPIDISSFFESMLGETNYDQTLMPFIAKEKELSCSFCNLEWDEFMKNGKFGCSNCYNTFENKVASILKRIHGDNKYLGRKGKTTNLGSNSSRDNVGTNRVRPDSEARTDTVRPYKNN